MKKNIVTLLGLAALLFLVNTSSEVTVSGHKKQAINVEGTLIDQQKNKKQINNISIGGKVEKIKIFQMLAPENMDPATHTLKQNPIDHATPGTLDLPKEVAEIMVPNPNEIWIYKEDKKAGRQTKYIEIVVIYKHDPANSEYHYLINTALKLDADEITPAGPQEIPDMSWQAVKKLIIKSYSERDSGTGFECKPIPQPAPATCPAPPKCPAACVAPRMVEQESGQ